MTRVLVARGLAAVLLVLCLEGGGVDAAGQRLGGDHFRRRADLHMGRIYGWDNPPYQVPLGTPPSWCVAGGDFGFSVINQNVPGCGHTCTALLY